MPVPIRWVLIRDPSFADAIAIEGVVGGAVAIFQRRVITAML
jgi:hypothetical protein